MPLIKRRTRNKKLIRHIGEVLGRDNVETLFAYARFLEEDPEYVLNEVVAKLAKDRDFVQWRTAHPESCIPRRMPRGRKRLTAAPSSSRVRQAAATEQRAPSTHTVS